MLICMKASRDLYYVGEFITIDAATVKKWIAAGVAEPALCPECGSQLEAAGMPGVLPRLRVQT
ncbi:hypothetical protein [Thermanaeromonas sp. C210]|uniref:hypothetical protein n=1 Tax=Thermanaeromonas sp. C210 TaxID=2731925 RepID=UPI00155D0B03|nr:hypothetical protein [Thermanaeromonas sp. C210]GFN21867.1 hypothetical protein TAMC210_01830 [Thermanaeromonas sp. C210]